MAFISRTWTWGNPITGQSSHSMRARFDVTATTDLTNVFVTVTNIVLDGWNEATPDTGNTQDHIVLARPTGSLPPGSYPAPARPIGLPFPGDLAARGGFSELATFLNGGNPQRYYWGSGSTYNYTIPYTGPNTIVIKTWGSRFEGPNILWSEDSWTVTLQDLDYRPGARMVAGSWESHNRGAGVANKRVGGAWSTMRTVNGGTGTGDPPYIRTAAVWRNQRKVGNNGG